MSQHNDNVISLNSWREKSMNGHKKSKWSADVSDSSIHLHHEPSGASFYFSRDGQSSFLSEDISINNLNDDPEILGDYLSEASEIAEQIAADEWTFE